MNTKELAWKIRRHGIEMTHASGASHIGAILSVADIVAVLYGSVMKVFPQDPRNDLRDRFILSKGHAGAAVYAALAEMGFFETDELKSYYSDGSMFSGHVSHKGVPGVELSTGSLGHGFGVGIGMAKAEKMDGKGHRVFVVLGDGAPSNRNIMRRKNRLYIVDWEDVFIGDDRYDFCYWLTFFDQRRQYGGISEHRCLYKRDIARIVLALLLKCLLSYKNESFLTNSPTFDEHIGEVLRIGTRD